VLLQVVVTVVVFIRVTATTTMEKSHREKGIAEIEKAVDCENAKDAVKAVEHYQLGLKWLRSAYDFEKNEIVRKELLVQMDKYVQRAERLKKHLVSPMINGGGNISNSFEQSIESTILTEVPKVSWDDVVGLEGAKKALQESVVLPLKFPSVYEENDIRPWKGILLFGPPGTGKSFLAKAVANEINCHFFSISSADIISKFVGDTEKHVKALFDVARKKQPSIIFIDEVDSIATSRDDEDTKQKGSQNELIVQMDGVGKDNKGVLMIGATNLPWLLDKAILRRFEKRFHVPLPDDAARAEIFRGCLPTLIRDTVTEDDLREFSALTSGYSGADIASIMNGAKFKCVEKLRTATHFKQIEGTDLFEPADEDGIEMTWKDLQDNKARVPPITKQDILVSIKETPKSVSSEDLGKFEEWDKKYGNKH